MGGDAFEGVQKLTNEQYQLLVAQITNFLAPYCFKIQAYIPLPQKIIHGDIDFILILKQQFQLGCIIQILKIEKFKINNNQTINSVYHNKQVDFCIVKEEQFQIVKFYKAYSGIGAYLGVFLSSKEVKLSDKGLYAIGYHKNVKFEFLLTNKPEIILQFYGLNYERFTEGFSNRKDLFQYMRGVKFLDEAKFVKKDQIEKNNQNKNSQPKNKRLSKLVKLFTQYLQQQGINPKKQFILLQNPLEQTLSYFHLQEKFKQEFNQILDSIQRKIKLNTKFNAKNIMQEFNIQAKNVNKIKQKFKSCFNSKQSYYEFIQNNDVESILKYFKKTCLQ